MIGYEVTCERCERRWDEADPGVRYDPPTGTWWCVHEPSCYLRDADTQAQFREWARYTARQLELCELPIVRL